MTALRKGKENTSKRRINCLSKRLSQGLTFAVSERRMELREGVNENGIKTGHAESSRRKLCMEGLRGSIGPMSAEQKNTCCCMSELKESERFK